MVKVETPIDSCIGDMIPSAQELGGRFFTDISLAYSIKYGWSNGLIVELTPYKEQGNRI